MIIDGSKIRDSLKKELRIAVKDLDKKPKLAIVLVGDNKVSLKYIEIKRQFAEDIGIEVSVLRSPETSEKNLIAEINKLNNDQDVSGIIIQLPLPQHINADKVLNTISPMKDIDCLSAGGYFESPVVKAVRRIFIEADLNYKDKIFLVIGSGRLVGRPVINFLRAEGINPVIIDENNKSDLKKETKFADVIISGAGQSHLIKKEMIKEGAFLIDAGTSYNNKELAGDIDPECYKKTSFYTPVPGGVGPITVAMLFKNLVENI